MIDDLCYAQSSLILYQTEDGRLFSAALRGGMHVVVASVGGGAVSGHGADGELT